MEKLINLPSLLYSKERVAFDKALKFLSEYAAACKNHSLQKAQNEETICFQLYLKGINHYVGDVYIGWQTEVVKILRKAADNLHTKNHFIPAEFYRRLTEPILITVNYDSEKLEVIFDEIADVAESRFKEII